MKKIIAIAATFCISLGYAQNVSEYQYIVIPKVFTGFEKKDYKLDQTFIKILKSKKYVPIQENTSEWEAIFRDNPCNLLKADILDDSSWTKNKVNVQFKDCDNKIVNEFKAGSLIKDYEEGYQDALVNSLKTLPTSSPLQHSDKQPKKEMVKQTPVYQEEVKKDPVRREDKVVTNSSNTFSNGKSSYQKIQIDDNQFILAEANSSIPFATFRATAKKDVYRVKLKTGENTLGYIEKGNIIIEMPKANGDFVNETFSAQ